MYLIDVIIITDILIIVVTGVWKQPAMQDIVW